MTGWSTLHIVAFWAVCALLVVAGIFAFFGFPGSKK